MMHKTRHPMREVFSQTAVAERVRAVADEINALYKGQPLVIVCVLKGAFMFFSDLVKHITVPGLELDFVRLASYGSGTESARVVSFTKDVEVSLADKHVLLVEDVVDSGHSMHFLFNQLQARGARSLRLAALVDKVERREVPVHVDFVAFRLSRGFIVGYGLGYAENYRELPSVFEILTE